MSTDRSVEEAGDAIAEQCRGEQRDNASGNDADVAQ
jgi:hypothetical protein